MSTPSYYRIEGIQQFEKLRRRARFCRLGMKLAKRPLDLLPFAPIYNRLPISNGIPQGLQEVSLTQIVGSLGRANDFDRHFRPLSDSQRKRWINIWVMHHLSGWDPITLHKIGNLYFVEDGHHRTSVAHALGLSNIIADIIDYRIPLQFDAFASLASLLAHLQRLAI